MRTTPTQASIELIYGGTGSPIGIIGNPSLEDTPLLLTSTHAGVIAPLHFVEAIEKIVPLGWHETCMNLMGGVSRLSTVGGHNVEL